MDATSAIDNLRDELGDPGADACEFHTTFEVAEGHVAPPDGPGWRLQASMAGSLDVYHGVWFVWWRVRSSGSRDWLDRALRAETKLRRERRRVRQLRRAVLAWAGRWAEAEASAQLRFNPEICDALVERSDSAWMRARDRSHDDDNEVTR